MRFERKKTEITNEALRAVDGDQKATQKRAARFGVVDAMDSIALGLLRLKGRIGNTIGELEAATNRPEDVLGEWPAPLTTFRGLMPRDLLGKKQAVSGEGEDQIQP